MDFLTIFVVSTLICILGTLTLQIEDRRHYIVSFYGTMIIVFAIYNIFV